MPVQVERKNQKQEGPLRASLRELRWAPYFLGYLLLFSILATGIGSLIDGRIQPQPTPTILFAEAFAIGASLYMAAVTEGGKGALGGKLCRLQTLFAPEIIPAIPATIAPHVNRAAPVVAPDSTLQEAAKLMRDKKAPLLAVVLTPDRLMGILTGAQIAVAQAAGDDPLIAKVSDHMLTDPPAVSITSGVSEAKSLMLQALLPQLPVLENGRFVGTVSLAVLSNPPTAPSG